MKRKRHIHYYAASSLINVHHSATKHTWKGASGHKVTEAEMNEQRVERHATGVQHSNASRRKARQEAKKEHANLNWDDD